MTDVNFISLIVWSKYVACQLRCLS